jgi:Ca2+-dependent lipid-binding protein
MLTLVFIIRFKRGRDIKNVELFTQGKSDPYVRVLSNGIIVGRTLVINNDLDPEWDEIIYVEVHSAKDLFTLEVMDYQHQSQPRPLGSTTLQLAPLIAEGSDKVLSPWISTGMRDYNESLRSGSKKTVKGSVSITLV